MLEQGTDEQVVGTRNRLTECWNKEQISKWLEQGTDEQVIGTLNILTHCLTLTF